LKGGGYTLDERKEKAITLLIQGERVTDVANKVPISRTTIYDWLHDPEFAAELETRRKDIVKSGNDFLLARVQSYLDQLDNLARTSNDSRTKASVLMYLVDRSLGKAVSRIEVDPVKQICTIPSREDLENEFKQYRLETTNDE
jgi:transposase